MKFVGLHKGLTWIKDQGPEEIQAVISHVERHHHTATDLML